ncbi:methylphosphotriester-DNA--protein-cysteine methyltransferase family protein [Kroppenstedtia pulmonis]|uniref:Methylphosphotriester-DNA--protein-cysteine methyltransferase family protein n=1 Tax=Kroppenstedtia pulmonis TaxID=1380685 RepID=A0A7D3XPB7_9BACL|nr:bifunctional transcriptional activator/DNA repair enzyme AdaA [Kroppenstedtia pulmonis]QKG83807.1 methylphosphotriester-DNA--protein-cysteine methyltransferase family protein [Kroppenstedtia pulmonis]
MTPKKEPQIPMEFWKAIVENDSSYDDQFYYGVQTTRIFCRPSCKSRVPNRENVRIFQSAEHALSERFRPCKRCKPKGLYLPDEEWVQQITEWIDQHYHEKLTLTTLADMCHGSPYHLQRTFKRIKGLTPMEYVHQVRVSQAAYHLRTSDQPIAEIGMAAGFPNSSYFITFFKKKTGYTPAKYRKIHQTNYTMRNGT